MGLIKFETTILFKVAGVIRSAKEQLKVHADVLAAIKNPSKEITDTVTLLRGMDAGLLGIEIGTELNTIDSAIKAFAENEKLIIEHSKRQAAVKQLWEANMDKTIPAIQELEVADLNGQPPESPIGQAWIAGMGGTFNQVLARCTQITAAEFKLFCDEPWVTLNMSKALIVLCNSVELGKELPALEGFVLPPKPVKPAGQLQCGCMNKCAGHPVNNEGTGVAPQPQEEKADVKEVDKAGTEDAGSVLPAVPAGEVAADGSVGVAATA